jgi:hypothetical protein
MKIILSQLNKLIHADAKKFGIGVEKAKNN